MATIKSHTDLHQSKKLAEILPLESADMYYEEVCNLPKVIVGNYILHNQCMEDKDYKKLSNPVLSPAWSLSALLSVLPTIDDEFEPQLHRSLDKYRCTYEGEEDSSGLWRIADNPVDACVKMIEKLHKLNLL